MLVDYYEAFLPRPGTLPRAGPGSYTETTLTRILATSEDAQMRCGAVLALGIIGTFAQSNDALGKALQDDDPVVRTMAESTLWAVWFRADSPENNQTLDKIRLLIGAHRLEAAIDLASRLIARTPNFAEAYNQRAIAQFIQGRYAQSAEDCQRVLQLDPYHVGALSGLAQCQLKLHLPQEALRTLRSAWKLQPHSLSIRNRIQAIEAQIESEGSR